MTCVLRVCLLQFTTKYSYLLMNVAREKWVELAMEQFLAMKDAIAETQSLH